MGIREDAGELLIFIYNEYISGNKGIESQEVIDTTKWEAGRINRAIKYLTDLDALEIRTYLGNVDGVRNFVIFGVNPLGIHMIEDEPTFQETFGFEIGIPGFKFSWSVTEK